MAQHTANGQRKEGEWRDVMSEEQRRVQRIVRGLTDALAEEFRGQASGCPQHELWLMADDTVQARHPAYPLTDDHVALMLDASPLDAWLGPWWEEGLDRDDGGRPIVSEELAREWAEGWADNNGAQAVWDAFDAIERAQEQERINRETEAEIRRREAGPTA